MKTAAEARALLLGLARDLDTCIASNLASAHAMDRTAATILAGLTSQAARYRDAIAAELGRGVVASAWGSAGAFGPNGAGAAIADIIGDARASRRADAGAPA